MTTGTTVFERREDNCVKPDVSFTTIFHGWLTHGRVTIIFVGTHLSAKWTGQFSSQGQSVQPRLQGKIVRCSSVWDTQVNELHISFFFLFFSIFNQVKISPGKVLKNLDWEIVATYCQVRFSRTENCIGITVQRKERQIENICTSFRKFHADSIPQVGFLPRSNWFVEGNCYDLHSSLSCFLSGEAPRFFSYLRKNIEKLIICFTNDDQRWNFFVVELPRFEKSSWSSSSSRSQGSRNEINYSSTFSRNQGLPFDDRSSPSRKYILEIMRPHRTVYARAARV